MTKRHFPLDPNDPSCNPVEMERRRFLDHAMKTALAAGFGGSLLAPLVHAIGNVPRQLPPGKSIYRMRGDFRVNGEKASNSTFINSNATLETGSNSYAIFAVGKDAHILRENSRMELSGSDLIEEGLRLITGKLLSVFGSRPAGQAHTVQTSTATIGIRGTGVYAESDPDVSYVCTCYGITEIASSRDQSSRERIQSVHHDAPRYIAADGREGSLIEPAPMKNHTDEELMLVEALVGRTPPFSGLRTYSAPKRSY